MQTNTETVTQPQVDIKTIKAKQKATWEDGDYAEFSTYMHDGAVEILEAWEGDALTVAVAEGLLYYLTRESVLELFAELAKAAPTGSRVAFSHLLDLDSYYLAQAALRLGGEPWLSASAPEELEDYVGPGWGIFARRPARRFHDLEGLAVVELV